jgi:hypothetical protein
MKAHSSVILLLSAASAIILTKALQTEVERQACGTDTVAKELVTPPPPPASSTNSPDANYYYGVS